MHLIYLNYLNLVSSQGLGYVEGYRVEYLNNSAINLRKGTDYANAANQIVGVNFGNYIQAKEVCGSFGSFSTEMLVELHNNTNQAVSSGNLLNTSYSASTKIGTAYVRSFVVVQDDITTSNTIYNFYLFDIVMNAGQNFQNVQSIVNYNGTNVLGVADIIPTFNATLNANVAQMQETNINGSIIPFGQKALKLDSFNNTQYTYRRKDSSSFAVDVSLSVDGFAG